MENAIKGFAHRQYLLTGLLLLLFLILLQFRSVGQSVTLSDISGLGARPRPRAVRIARVAPRVPARHGAASPAEMNGLPLGSLVRDYAYVFSGVVRCGDEPCSADLELNVDTTHNEGISHRARTRPDGAFTMTVAVSEVPHEPIIWKLTARSGSKIGESHGQQILMDDRTVTVDQPVNLSEI